MKPKGLKDSSNGGLEPRYYNLNGLWDLKPVYWELLSKGNPIIQSVPQLL